MILQKELRDLAASWGVPPDTVDKDYVLGHFLSGFYQHFGDQLIFKGGTCLRKCYFPGYRFSEDVDFSSLYGDFVLTADNLKAVCQTVQEHSGILFDQEPVKPLLHQDKPKGYQVKIRYWGANHSKNQEPPPPERWLTKIKLEISTDEVLVTSPSLKAVHHPYSDTLINNEPIECYTINEVIAEKLRSLVQRSYTAPRDIYDIYQLTHNASKEDWQRIIPIFKTKMEHKGLTFNDVTDLIDEKALDRVRKAWDKSLAHQIPETEAQAKTSVIQAVVERIQAHMA
jgi:predicted nucleotidyltransferase component of viral defense system